MKKFYTTLFLLTCAAMTFAQPYFIYTAKKTGYWYDNGNWHVHPRTDGIRKHKAVIPAGYRIIVDNNVNSMGLGDIEVYISGSIDLVPNTTLNLSGNSSIQLNNGSISGNAANQQILLGGIIKYKGDVDYTKAGHSIADITTGSSPIGFRPFAALPVNFTGFYIHKTDENVQLAWSTDKEMNNSHFDVERSSNGVNWEKIAIVFSAGNGENANNYTYRDKIIITASVYYRLRQVDMDGRFIYSSVKNIRLGETMSAVKISGFEKTVVIDLNSSIKNNIVVSVVNSNGQLVSQRTYSKPLYKIRLDLHSIAPGSYIVQVSDNKGWTEVKKVIL